MIGNEQVLRDIVRIAQCGRDFSAEVYPRIADAEVRAAFVYVREVKMRLADELAPWLPRTEIHSTVVSPSVAILEKLYSDLRTNSDGYAFASVANALSFGEDQLLKLVRRAGDEARAPALKRLLKSYYTDLSIYREAMWRLHSRLAA